MTQFSLTISSLVVVFSGAIALAQDDVSPAPTPSVAVEDRPAVEGDDGGLFVNPNDLPDDNAEAPEPEVEPIDAPDFPVGELAEVDAEVLTYRFAAESAGMLTLIVQAPDMRIDFQIENAQGRPLPVDNGRQANFQIHQQAQEIGFRMLTFPISEAGEYAVKLNLRGDDVETLLLGGTWIEFEQIGALPAIQPGIIVPPVAPPPPPPAAEPGDDTPDLIIGENLELEIEGQVGWARIVIEEDGTLVVAGPRNGRSQLFAHRDGNFANNEHWANNSGMLLFHAQANEVWYIKVNNPNGRNLTVQIRSTLIPDDLEEYIPDMDEDE